MAGQGFRPWQRSRRLIAGRQNHAVCFHCGGIRESNDGGVACGFDVQDFARDKLRRDRGHAVRALQMMVHDRAQIVAIHHAWNEAFAQLDFRHGVVLRARAQPSQEMIRLIPKSGHISRGNVQQVFRASRAVGNASPCLTATIDDCHVKRMRVLSRARFTAVIKPLKPLPTMAMRSGNDFGTSFSTGARSSWSRNATPFGVRLTF